ncbi:MAG: hypothetical protein ACOYXM_11365 [Actinomycetota bacterium]
MSDVDQAVVAPVDDVEWARRAARAEVARLSLAVRAAQRDTALREMAAVEVCALASAAEALLAQSLDELVEARRTERQRDLAVAIAAAEQVAADALERAELHNEPPSSTGQPDVSATAVALDEPPSSTAQPGGPSTAASLDELRSLVQAAVAAGLAEAREQAVATLHLVPAVVGPPTEIRRVPAAQRPAEPRSVGHLPVDESDETPFWRRLVHADVLLPLIAALIVTVVFAAWMG